jgi:heat shock protein HslJ
MRVEKLLLLTIVLMLSACAPAATEVTTPTVEPTGPSSDENSLANTQWTLVSFGIADAENPIVEGSAITLEFKADGQAGGSGGCNSYGGAYQVQGNTLSFSQINSTLMACADEKMMQQEQQYFQALESAGQFELTDDHLTISYNNGQAVLNFVKASSSASMP